MLSLESKHSVSALSSRWDERTSPARFAGNDDVLDMIYFAKRKGNKVFLVRKGSRSLDLFATVFRGQILPHGEGSVLQGSFSKRLSAYLLLAVLLVLDGAFAAKAYSIGVLDWAGAMGCLLVAALLILAAIPLPGAKKRYTAFMREITDEE